LPLGIAPATASQTLSENPSLAQAVVPGVDAVAWPMLVVPALGPAVALSWRCYGRTMLELSSQSPGPKPMSQYKVMVDDNFHYMEEDERWEYGTFATAAAAFAACRKVVDESLIAEFRPGITATQLYDRYTSFGDEPFIIAPPGATEDVSFSARDYARSRIEALCAAKSAAGSGDVS
jgi:hypothetical protein